MKLFVLSSLRGLAPLREILSKELTQKAPSREENWDDRGPEPISLRSLSFKGESPMRAHWLLGLSIVLFLGCSGSKKFAPVSGTVTVNGKPLANATVSFMPVAEQGSIEAGDSSVGKTNEKGEYILKSSKGKGGAQVGKHKVSVSLLSEQAGDRDERPPRGGWPMADKVPAKYNAKTELTYEVTAGGTDKADFPLKSP